jgi:3-oxoacyl-[acyl-carrier-protein] synthase II
VGDLSEINAMQTVFGGNFSNLKVSATKSMTGHLLGAAGAVEAILSVKAIEKNIIPPTINTTELDPEIPGAVSIVLGDAIDHQVNAAMSNTFGFGGHNAILVFKGL